MIGIPIKRDKKKNKKLKIEKKSKGFSSLIKTSINFSIFKPSLYVLSLLKEPEGLAL